MLVACLGSDLAGAQSAECQQLRAEIASAGASRQSGAYDAAAQRQRSEIDRTIAYSRSIGCEKRKFLFFGDGPPPQCGAIDAQIARMQANLGQLQERGSGGGGGARAELVARYQSECANPQPRSHGLFDALFGAPRDEPPPPRVVDVPLVPDPNADPLKSLNDGSDNGDGQTHEARAGSKAVCVRTCDGYFFPVSYAASGHMSDLADMCHALCPNAEVALYSYSPSGDIDQAVSIDGERYVDLPNAFKYRKSVDQTCTCRPRGQSWAQALVEAEQKLGEHKSDILVTPEKSAEMARPAPNAPAAVKGKPGKTQPDVAKLPAQPELTPTDPLLGQQQPTAISREPSGIAVGDAASGPSYSKDQGQTREVVGPDGLKRRVRIIDPTL